MARDHRNEQPAVLDLPADHLIPPRATAQLALIEPDFDTGGAQGLANLLRRLGILRGVAEKHSARRLGQGSCPQILLVVMKGEDLFCEASATVAQIFPHEAMRPPIRVLYPDSASTARARSAWGVGRGAWGERLAGS